MYEEILVSCFEKKSTIILCEGRERLHACYRLSRLRLVFDVNEGPGPDAGKPAVAKKLIRAGISTLCRVK